MIDYVRLMNYSKHTILEKNVDSGREFLNVRAGDTWGMSASASQFCSKSKTTFKNTVKKHKAVGLPQGKDQSLLV